ncbi:MAG: sugar transferase [Proteobacteria bacterium]|nr:sugar transferase [Pseudomonadota bacterium]
MSTDSTPSHPAGHAIAPRTANVGAVRFLFEWPVALLLFALSLTPIAVLAICIKLIDRGPAFYLQERVGLNGKPFKIIKLRTMRTNAVELLDDYLESNPEEREEWLRHFKLRSDPRIIPRIGLFLRKYSLDEMPQLWNVLRGDMGLVGPRPFPAYHLAGFDADFRALRESVRPGITGLWQVEVRSDGDLLLQKELDSRYILTQSLWTDLDLLFRTVWVVFSARGAR